MIALIEWENWLQSIKPINPDWFLTSLSIILPPSFHCILKQSYYLRHFSHFEYHRSFQRSHGLQSRTSDAMDTTQVSKVVHRRHDGGQRAIGYATTGTQSAGRSALSLRHWIELFSFVFSCFVLYEMMMMKTMDFTWLICVSWTCRQHDVLTKQWVLRLFIMAKRFGRWSSH